MLIDRCTTILTNDPMKHGDDDYLFVDYIRIHSNANSMNLSYT